MYASDDKGSTCFRFLQNSITAPFSMFKRMFGTFNQHLLIMLSNNFWCQSQPREPAHIYYDNSLAPGMQSHQL